MTARTVYCVSDHTGLTAEAFAHSLMSRFDAATLSYSVEPFVDSREKADAVVAEIDAAAVAGPRPIVFVTFSSPELQAIIEECRGLVISVFGHAVDLVSQELGIAASTAISDYHGIGDAARYELRLEAVDFSLTTDDGLGIEHYERADVILVGVSRVGKTPSCLYLSMHYGIRAANYPISPDDHADPSLPPTLRAHRRRIYGLTIDPRQLSRIRFQRRPNSPYANVDVCRREVAYAERMFRAEQLPSLDTTTRSIEEITATIIQDLELSRRL